METHFRQPHSLLQCFGLDVFFEFLRGHLIKKIVVAYLSVQLHWSVATSFVILRRIWRMQRHAGVSRQNSYGTCLPLISLLFLRILAPLLVPVGKYFGAISCDLVRCGYR